MNNTHDKIYLINAGDEITWCDDPAPAPNMDERDAVTYIKGDKIPIEEIKEIIADVRHYINTGDASFLKTDEYELDQLDKFLEMVER